MKLKLEITMDNAAFESQGPEVARIFRDLADQTEERDLFSPKEEIPIRDSNGNRVGQVRFTR